MRIWMLLAAVALAPSLAPAGDHWPEFRGPTADGRSDATGLPVTFSETENVKWKTPVEGKAWSSPVVWGQQIWMTNAPEDGKQMVAVCLDLDTGKIVHNVLVFENEKLDFCIPMNSFASPTPAIEEGRVYVHFGKYGTACLDTQSGKILWQRRDFECDHHRGPASSPILHENLLIFNQDGFDLQYVVALDKRTGETVWKRDRNIEYKVDNGDLKKAYGTPTVFNVGGQPLLVSPSAGAAIAYRPATGEEVWRVNCGGMNNAARPVMAHGLVYMTTAAGGWQLYAVRPDGTGDVSKSHVAWKFAKSVPTRSSQILVDDLLFMISDAGVATCLDAKTGEAHWQKRISGKYSASPLYADGYLYFFGEDGEVPVLKASRQFEQVADNKLGTGFMASPAVVGKSLILRSRTHVYRIEK